MRKLTAITATLAGLTAAFAWGGQPGASAPMPLSLSYAATLHGLPLANVDATVDPASPFRLTGDLRTSGIVGLFSPWQHRAASSGRLAEDRSGILGVRHRGDGVYRGSPRHIQLLFDPSSTVVEAAEPDPEEESDGRRVPPEARSGTVDPLTAFFLLAKRLGAGDGCEGVLRIYDGRQRYDLELSEGPEELSCRFLYRQIAGFSKRKPPVVESDRRLGVIRYTRLAESLPPVPQRLEVPSRYGSVVVALTDWRVSTEAQASR